MAIIKTLRYPITMTAMFEDPQPGSDYIYFHSDAYSKSNLNPYFDAGIIYTTDGSLSTGKIFGWSRPLDATGYGIGGALMLNGETTHVRHTHFFPNNGNIWQNNLDPAPFMSMDPTRPIKPSQYFTDGINNLVLATFNYYDGGATNTDYYLYINTRHWYKINTTPRDLATSGYLTKVTYMGSTSPTYNGGWYFGQQVVANNGTISFPLYRNPTTNNLIWVSQATGTAAQAPYALSGAVTSSTFVASPTPMGAGPTLSDTSAQFIGASYRDGFAIYFQNDVAQDGVHKIVKFNDGNMSVSTLYASPTSYPPYPSAMVAAPDYPNYAYAQTGTYYVTTPSPNLDTGVIAQIMTATVSATIIGSISGSVLTVLKVNTGTFVVGQQIAGTGVTAGTTVTSVASIGAGGTGTFNLSLTGTSPADTTISAALTTTILASILPGFTQVGGTQLGVMTVYATNHIAPTVTFPVTTSGGRLYPGMNISNPLIGVVATLTSIVRLTTATGIATSSTNVGGNRSVSFGNQYPKYASKTFQDVTTSSARGFYVPYVSIQGLYNPHYFQWNTATDIFSRSTNVVMVYPGGTSTGTQNTYFALDTVSITGLSQSYGMQRVWYNEVITSSSGTRYLIFMQLHGGGGIYDTTSTFRTMPVYSIDPNNPLILTYSSSITVPQTPKNIVWLNSSKTLLGVICQYASYIYYFTPGTWQFQLTATFPYQFWAMGTDNYSRVWAYDVGPQSYGRIHLLSNVPTTISVVANTSTYTYSGSTSTTTFSVNAYDITASRMTATLNLSVNGSSLLLLNNVTNQYVSTLTVVTSTSTNTVVWGQIINSGPSSISATVTI
jgi:hypothetical protein